MDFRGEVSDKVFTKQNKLDNDGMLFAFSDGNVVFFLLQFICS